MEPDKYDKGIAFLREIHEEYGEEVFEDVVQQIWNAPTAPDEEEINDILGWPDSEVDYEDVKAAGSLFTYVTPTGHIVDNHDRGVSCGCLTQIRDGGVAYNRHVAFRYDGMDFDLTEEIQEDERIPVHPREITLESLPVFAEWQRRLDIEIRNV